MLVRKASAFGRNAVTLAPGGSVAYAGLIISLMGLGCLLAWALQQAGLQPLLAGFLGLAIVGILIAAMGTAFVLKGLKLLTRRRGRSRYTFVNRPAQASEGKFRS